MPKYPNGHEFEMKRLYPSQIKFDPLYQRNLDLPRVNKIVKEFDGDLFNEPKVSYRDGTFWFFNGQHSIAAWRKLHDNKDEPLTCKVFKGMTWLEECEAFIKQNGISKDPTTNQKLKASYNAKNPDVVDMVEKAEFVGFTVDFVTSQTPTRILATSALFMCYQKLGAEAYLNMLTVLRDAWYGDQDAVSAQIIRAMTTFYKTYYGQFRSEDLVNALKKVAPSVIIRNGKNFSNVKNSYALEIVKLYNMRRKNRLDETKL